jgi:hypothetical protein
VNFEPSFRDVGAIEHHYLETGQFPVVRETVTVEKGQVLTRGALLGKKTTSSKFVLSAAKDEQEAAIEDGSQNPLRILAADVDATERDKQAAVYVTGKFYKRGVQLGKGHSFESIKDALELRSIYFED